MYWVTGLSGAGKTTVGYLLYEKIRLEKETVVFLDGDTLREVFGGDLGYTVEDRHTSAMRNARICRLLSDAGLDVVCCTISMFEDVRLWNRKHIPDYCEIYLKVPEDVLRRRNQKGLYDSELQNLVGFGVAMEEPKQPNVVIVNDGERSPAEIADEILIALKGGYSDERSDRLLWERSSRFDQLS